MLAFFFLISINYHILKILKDSLIITAPKSGAEVIPFLKVWAMLPTAILVTSLFTKLANKHKRENLFYFVALGFISFFLFFILVLYPNRESLHLHKFADSLSQILPVGFSGMISLIRYWVYALFYVIAESWSTLMLSILMWGFANDVITIQESKRFYPLFGVGKNSSGIIAGQLGALIATKLSATSFSITPFAAKLGAKTPWDQTLLFFIMLVVGLTLLAIIIHYRLYNNVFSEHKTKPQSANSPINKKPKMSLRSSVSYVLKSKYVLYIAVTVLAYNAIINFSEVLWKSQIKELYPSPADYTAYMSKVTSFIGIFATFTAFFISGGLIRKFEWKIAASTVPFIMYLSGALFFYFLFNKHFGLTKASIFGMTPLMLAVLFGSIQNCLSRAAKFTIFDNTKEMALIPLSKEDKLKGKAAIDGVGSRLGKSGSSLMMQLLLIFFSTPIGCSPAILVLFILIIPFWLKAINYVGKEYEERTAPKLAPVIETTKN